MKKIFIIFSLAACMLTACSDDDDMLNVSPSERGTVTDNMGNEYGWVRIGDLCWTTSNAKNGSPMTDAVYYDAVWGQSNYFSRSRREQLKAEYIPKYGNLMMYEDALASAPEGWRLPTDDDWKNLERSLGMGSDVNNKGWRGSHAASLMMQGDEGTGLNLMLGGAMMMTTTFVAMSYDLWYEGEYGLYWTATTAPEYTDFTGVYYRKITPGTGKVERQVSKTDKYMSVRWVRDAR